MIEWYIILQHITIIRLVLYVLSKVYARQKNETNIDIVFYGMENWILNQVFIEEVYLEICSSSHHLSQ